MVNSEELIGTTEYVTLYMRCRLNRCCYNGIRPHVYSTWWVVQIYKNLGAT
jgi:hypothetical protein